ncbi:acyltransferase [Serratia fonticola]|uniref:acyltransferase n=1 Tax=Serratia fonticola TaxID=47917 RepID=UPI003BB80E7F
MKYIKMVIRFFFTNLAMIRLASYKTRPRVNYYSRFTKRTHLGKNCHFNGMKVLGKGKVYIGDNFHSGSECQIITDTHNFLGTALPYDSTFIVKDVVIGDNVWIGQRVIILGGVTIGDGAIIQAGSVVVKSIESLGIAGGHPATVFKYRDSVHYKSLLLTKDK